MRVFKLVRDQLLKHTNFISFCLQVSVANYQFKRTKLNFGRNYHTL